MPILSPKEIKFIKNLIYLLFLFRTVNKKLLRLIVAALTTVTLLKNRDSEISPFVKRDEEIKDIQYELLSAEIDLKNNKNSLPSLKKARAIAIKIGNKILLKEIDEALQEA